MIRICSILSILIFVFGCNDTIDNFEAEKSKLATARYKWNTESSSFVSYSFNSRAFYFGPFRDTVKISVVNDEIASITDINTLSPVLDNDTGIFKTIDQWFVWIENSLDKHPESFSIKYNEQYGYPEEFNFDYDLDALDEQFGLEIDSLKFQ